MNLSTTAIDYEAERRARQAREERQAALLRMKVRGVARLLGGRFLEEDADRSSHTIELAPTVQLWARRDWQKKDMIHWGARCPLAAHHSAPTVCTAIGRPVAAIAADLRRRLVPVAYAACKTAMENAARTRDQEHARNAQVAELEHVLGPLKKSHDNQSHYTEGFSIHRSDLVGGGFDGQYRAEVRVRSWHCLLMIAQLVAEDARLAAKETQSGLALGRAEVTTYRRVLVGVWPPDRFPSLPRPAR